MKDAKLRLTMQDDDDFIQDVPGNNKRLKKKLKLAVKHDVSESDSDASDDEEHQPRENEEQGAKSDDDSDMFASDTEPEPQVTKKPNNKKPEPKRLNIDEFNREMGLEQQVTDQDHEPEAHYENYSEVQAYYNNIEDYQDGHDGVKTKLEPKMVSFYLEKEENGYYDEEGNYVQNAPPEDEEPEDWMNNIDHKQIRQAQLAESHRLAQIQKNSTQPTEPISELLNKLIDVLDIDETPMEALSRFAPKKLKRRHRVKNEDSQENKQKKSVINLITDVCNKLMNQKAISEIYELTREEMMRMYTSETGQDYKPKRGTKRQLEDNEEVIISKVEAEQDNYGEKDWEFKWEDLDDINGPYSEYEIKYWKDNYFDNKVYVKKINEEAFVHISDVDFN